VERHALLEQLEEQAPQGLGADADFTGELGLLPGAALEEGLVDGDDGFGLAALAHGGIILAV
jgi:hypothetical protein